MMRKLDISGVPELGGWVTIQRAADAMGVTRQAVSKRVHQGRLGDADLRRVSYGEGANNDLLLVSVTWVRSQVLIQRQRAEKRRAQLDANADAVPSLDYIDDEAVVQAQLDQVAS